MGSAGRQTSEDLDLELIDGPDGRLTADEGEVASEIGDFISRRIHEHATGPSTYLYVILRRRTRQGNLAVTPAIKVGGEDAHAVLTRHRADAMSSAVSVIPGTFALLDGLVRALAATNAKLFEGLLESRTTLARIEGESEGSDAASRDRMVAVAIENLGPLATEVVGMMRARRSATPPPPQTAADLEAVFAALPDAERRKFVGEILEQLRAQGWRGPEDEDGAGEEELEEELEDDDSAGDGDGGEHGS